MIPYLLQKQYAKAAKKINSREYIYDDLRNFKYLELKVKQHVLMERLEDQDNTEDKQAIIDELTNILYKIEFHESTVRSVNTTKFKEAWI